MPQELADIILDTLAGDNDDDEITEMQNVVDVIFDAL